MYVLQLYCALLGLLVSKAIVKGIYLYVRRWKAVKERGCRPATSYWNLDPFLGLDLFVRIRKADLSGKRSMFYKDLHSKLGRTFEMKTCGPTEVQVADPENIKAIAATNFNDWGVGPMRGNIGAPFLDRGIFTEDGDFWKHSRALVRPTFNKAEVADLPSFEEHVRRFMALIPEDGTTVDMLPLAKRLFMDTSTEFLFGESVRTLLPETPFDADRFMKAFDRSLLNLALRLLAGPFSFLLWLDPGYKKAYTVVHEFVDKHVAKALERREKTDDNHQASSGKYILLDGMAEQIQDPIQLRAQIINVFFPARDTSAIAVSNSLWELSQHPQWWTALRSEALALGDQPLTFELIKTLKATKAILNEVLRLHLPSSRIGRTALRDTTLPVGGGADGRSPIFVPKGRVAEMDLFTLHRDVSTWGDDANEFKPDRWAEGRPLWESKWQYAPFLGGIRMCPAQNQVLIQVSYLLVRMAQEFETLEFRDDVTEYVEEIKLTVESRRGVKVGLIRPRVQKEL